MLQTEEERLGKILDADYSKVDIDDMVDNLDVAKVTKQKLKQTLKEYPILFVGRLRHIRYGASEKVLQPNVKLYASKFYNVPKANKDMAKIKVNILCTV